jgi:endonuclease YncB( thermonuclease family)
VSQTLQESYLNLRAAVQGAIEAGGLRARAAVAYETAVTYWEVGGLIQAYVREQEGVYGRAVYKQLSVDLGLRERLLYEMVEVNRAFPNLRSTARLTWAHYSRLSSVSLDVDRMSYLNQAADGGWTVRELDARIKLGTEASSEAPCSTETLGRMPRAKRGRLYEYRVVEREGRRMLDLGFRASYPLPEGLRFEVGDLVRTVKDRRVGFGYRIALVSPIDARNREGRQPVHYYAYRATLLRIIDGDTIWATIDFGFGVRVDHKLRLRGIDTPEIDTVEGRVASEWLAARLAQVPAFVVTTTKVDLYDRDLADLYVMEGEADLERVAREGGYVNREMVEAGLARVWE